MAPPRSLVCPDPPDGFVWPRTTSALWLVFARRSPAFSHAAAAPPAVIGLDGSFTGCGFCRWPSHEVLAGQA